MKTPVPVSPNTSDQSISLINSGNFVDFDLYTITLFGGGVLRFTTAPFDISNGTFIWSSKGVRVDAIGTRALARWKVGVDSDQWVVVIIPRASDPISGAAFPDQIGSVAWAQAAHSGALDAADVLVQRAYFATNPSYPAPGGLAFKCFCTLTIFAGIVCEIVVETSRVTMTINDYKYLLTMPMPRHVFQASCRHTLFDPGCNNGGTSNPPANFVKSGTVAAGSVPGTIIASAGLAAPGGSGTWTLGRMVFTSGLNNTFQQTIANWDGNQQFQFVQPFPYAPSPGDAFNVFPGCDKRFTTCGLFGIAVNGNQDNFGGQPYIPVPETAL